MSDRAHVSTKQESFDRLDSHRREEESWSDIFERAADVLDAVDGDDANGPETDLDELAGKIDDLRAELPKELGEEIENRLTGR